MAAQDAQQRDPQGEFLLHTIIPKVSTELYIPKIYISHILYEIQMKKQKKYSLVMVRPEEHDDQLQISNAN